MTTPAPKPPVSIPVLYQAPFLWRERAHGREMIGVVSRRLEAPLRFVPAASMEVAPDRGVGEVEVYDEDIPREQRLFEGGLWRRPWNYREGMAPGAWLSVFAHSEAVPELAISINPRLTGARGRIPSKDADCRGYAHRVETYEAEAEIWARSYARDYVVCDETGPWVRQDWPYGWWNDSSREGTFNAHDVLGFVHLLRKPDPDILRMAAGVRRMHLLGLVGAVPDEHAADAARAVEGLCGALQARGFRRDDRRLSLERVRQKIATHVAATVPELPDEDVDALAAAGP